MAQEFFLDCRSCAQPVQSGRGFTDIEIEFRGKFCVIIEAKRRVNLPIRRQLVQYARRRQFLRYPSKSKHCIEKYETVTNLVTRIPEIEDREHGPAVLYYLGPAFRPEHEVPTGDRILHATRVRCMLDTLFTCRTITQAWELSKKRGGQYD